MTNAPMLALSQGDPSGIGPEIALMAWERRNQLAVPFVVFGDPALMAARAKQIGLEVPIRAVPIDDAASTFATALPVVATRNAARGEPGRPDSRDAACTIEAIEAAVRAAWLGQVSAVVTNPIAKHVLYDAGFRFPGHTEFLGHLTADHWGESVQPVMLLWSEALAVVPVTIHVALAKVPALLTQRLIVDTARTVHAALRSRFGVTEPRLACAGLNPHAGEDGSMGREEIEIIGPALDQLRREGIAVAGPLSADTMFHPEARSRYDVALTMYHDQGLIPVKTLSFDTGVNVTLGLPFVRTSPDHGTAFVIAGRGTANPASLIAALQLAARLVSAPGV